MNNKKPVSGEKPPIAPSILTVRLGLIGSITEGFEAMNKQLRAFVRKAVAHKPIWVFLAAVVVSIPCLAEPPAINGAKVTPELMCGGKVIGKDLDQRGVQRMSAKPGENGRVNSGAECGSGITATNIPMNLESAKNADKRGDQDDSETVGDYVQAVLIGMIAWIPLMLTFTKKPNVKLTGRAEPNP